jgi:hypothetical protein
VVDRVVSRQHGVLEVVVGLQIKNLQVTAVEPSTRTRRVSQPVENHVLQRSGKW